MAKGWYGEPKRHSEAKMKAARKKERQEGDYDPNLNREIERRKKISEEHKIDIKETEECLEINRKEYKDNIEHYEDEKRGLISEEADDQFDAVDDHVLKSSRETSKQEGRKLQTAHKKEIKKIHDYNINVMKLQDKMQKGATEDYHRDEIRLNADKRKAERDLTYNEKQLAKLERRKK